MNNSVEKPKPEAIADQSLDIEYNGQDYKIEFDIVDEDQRTGDDNHSASKIRIIRIINEDTYEDVNPDSAEALPIIKKAEEELDLIDESESIDTEEMNDSIDN